MTSILVDHKAGMDAYRRGDYAAAYRILRPLAEQGDSGAQYQLGVMYAGGEGVLQEDTEALRWYRKSAELGNLVAQMELGFIYSTGEGVSQDNVEAERWFRRFSEHFAEHFRNSGLEPSKTYDDYLVQTRWYRIAAERAVEERRAAVRECSTDAERLLSAVGEETLRQGLPSSLLSVLESDGAALTGIQVADTAIAVHHTDALREHRRALGQLDPPRRWAGSERAVDFVRSLGFSPEWAGERRKSRDPYLEVDGPCFLPDLHSYQLVIAQNVRAMLRNEYGDGAGRRGLISMPTGSGKTRVAVQAIVEAMCDDGLRGGVVWVADRDELCEQAVEAWRQAWSKFGAQGARLRISRMWGGEARPLAASELHVIVTTIQTLNARLSAKGGEYDFLSDFELVVVDEAHRSIAPTFTSVMQEIGLTRFRREDEPFLLGLTATPYRGRDETETARLAGRYGNNRLDEGAFSSRDPQAVIRELQNMGVLAQADHETIEGETFSADMFSPQELEQAKSSPWLPQSVEDRIAQSVERTRPSLPT